MVQETDVNAFEIRQGELTKTSKAFLKSSASLEWIASIIIAVRLALNAASISTFTASPEKYKKKKATAIAAIVFNFIAIVLLIISITGLTNEFGAFLAFPLFALIPNNGFIAILVIVLLCVLAATVLAIVDLSLEKKRVYSNPKPAQPETVEATAETQPKDNE